MNEFISFWFETTVDGVVRYETHLDFMREEWSTWDHESLGAERQSLVSGALDSRLSEDAMVEAIKPIVTKAIRQRTSE